jgi:hypothetical protein
MAIGIYMVVLPKSAIWLVIFTFKSCINQRKIKKAASVGSSCAFFKKLRSHDLPSAVSENNIIPMGIMPVCFLNIVLVSLAFNMVNFLKISPSIHENRAYV